MSNDSTVAGPLLPNPPPAPAPLLGQSLNRFLGQWIAGITGIASSSVLPRWQPEPANYPSGPWVAFGITKRVADFTPYLKHVCPDDGSPEYDELHRHEVLTLLLSFYDLGVNGQADFYAEQFREGVQIPQNLELLQLNDMGLVETGECITVPSLVKERWLYRVDLPLVIRRRILKQYPVLSLLEAQVFLQIENAGGTELVVDEPSLPQFPLFGVDVDNDYLAGVDVGVLT